MIEILLESGIQTQDSLLLAIDEQYVEGVELLLEHEERLWSSQQLGPVQQSRSAGCRDHRGAASQQRMGRIRTRLLIRTMLMRMLMRRMLMRRLRAMLIKTDMWACW